MGRREPCAVMTLRAPFHIHSQNMELHTNSLKQLYRVNKTRRDMYTEESDSLFLNEVCIEMCESKTIA